MSHCPACCVRVRACLLACLFACLLGACPPVVADETPTAASLWQSYKASPNTHENIPNVSYAGYRYGEVPPPPPGGKVVANVRDFGAVGDGKADDTDAILKALKTAAEKGGGAVLLPAGSYVVTKPIFIRYSGVVLRGEGTDKTILVAPKPLDAMYGRNRSGSSSRWSWSGGLVWFAPESLRPDAFVGQDKWREGWPLERKVQATITRPARRGDTVLTVADASALTPGQRVVLHMTSTDDHAMFKRMCADVPGTDTWDWSRKAAGLLNPPDWKWPVEIAAVDGNQVTLRQPLRLDIDTAWQPTLYGLGDVISESGVEHLTIRFPATRLSAHLQNPGQNGIYFENAWDCWARDIVIENTDNGIGTAASKCVTLDRFVITGRDCHHATYCRVESHDILWTRYRIESKCHHGINVEGLATGNVWSAADHLHGTFDSHRALPFENVRTDIRVNNTGGHGGAGTAGPLFGARFVHWNILVTNNRPHMIFAPTHMPRGALVGIRGTKPEAKPYPDFDGDPGAIVADTGKAVEPQDLHIAQLMHRMGKAPLHLGRDLAVEVFRSDGKQLVIRWHDPAPRDRTYHVQRRTLPGEWQTLATVDAPLTHFIDRTVEPGVRYAWRVSVTPRGRDAGPWFESPAVHNLPEPLEGLRWTPADGGSAVTLHWTASSETAGRVLVERQPRGGDDTTWTRVAELPVNATSCVDRSVTPAQRYTHRIFVANDSGQGEPVSIDTFTRDSDVRLFVEDFTVERTAGLPTKSLGKQTLGTWRYRGTGRDRAPAFAADSSSPLIEGDESKGRLAWPSTPNHARSFVWTEDVQLDLAAVGSQVDFDYLVGSSGISTHIVGLCIRVGDRWYVGGVGHTQQLMAWYRWSRVLHELDWRAFDPVEITAVDEAAKPDLSRVTGIGLFIDRPINNRFIYIDNLRIWAARP